MHVKYIRQANGWLVTEPALSKNNKKAQKFNWFSSEKEAKNYLLNHIHQS